jgi:hypothetical protein
MLRNTVQDVPRGALFYVTGMRHLQVCACLGACRRNERKVSSVVHHLHHTTGKEEVTVVYFEK